MKNAQQLWWGIRQFLTTGGPIQLVSVIRKQATNYFRIQSVLYQLRNLKLWRELATILIYAD